MSCTHFNPLVYLVAFPQKTRFRDDWLEMFYRSCKGIGKVELPFLICLWRLFSFRFYLT